MNFYEDVSSARKLDSSMINLLLLDLLAFFSMSVGKKKKKVGRLCAVYNAFEGFLTITALRNQRVGSCCHFGGTNSWSCPCAALREKQSFYETKRINWASMQLLAFKSRTEALHGCCSCRPLSPPFLFFLYCRRVCAFLRTPIRDEMREKMLCSFISSQVTHRKSVSFEF